MLPILGSIGDNARNHGLVRRAQIAVPLGLVVSFVAIVSGCSEARVPVFPVSGKVSFQGKPPAGAQVVLHAVNSSEPTVVAPSGTVQQDGTFKITAYDPGDGAPQGDYVVTVEWFKLISEGGGGRGPNVLPKKFASAKTSPIKLSVAGGPVDVPSIDIK